MRVKTVGLAMRRYVCGKVYGLLYWDADLYCWCVRFRAFNKRVARVRKVKYVDTGLPAYRRMINYRGTPAKFRVKKRRA